MEMQHFSGGASIAALELLAEELGRLEDKAFRLNQGHVSYLIALARQDLQSVIKEASEELTPINAFP